MFFLSTVMLFSILSSCSTDELTVKKNWTFIVTTVTTYTMDSTVTEIMTTTIDRDDLTEIEAEAIAVGMRSSTNTT